MYQNDSGQGFIRMAEGTTPPHHYYYPACYMLDPKFIESQQLFLTKNGVVLFFGDFIPAEYLHLQEQLPTLACPVLRPGRGHMLPPSATGGTWPADVSYGHVRREKGVGFVAGGEVPQTVRTTAWQFMGQEISPNYGKLVFGFPLQTEVDFDPTIESGHGLAAGSSLQREEPAPKSPPMQNPYEQPSRRTGRSSQQEEPGQEGSSPHREEPDSQWEQQLSSSGSSEPPDQEDHPVDEQPDQEATSTNVQDDPMGEEVVDLWEAEDPPDDDYVVEQATSSSISASNPWVLYMRQALLSVLVMRMVTYNETLQVRRLLSSENGRFCLDLSELL